MFERYRLEHALNFGARQDHRHTLPAFRPAGSDHRQFNVQHLLVEKKIAEKA